MIFPLAASLIVRRGGIGRQGRTTLQSDVVFPGVSGSHRRPEPIAIMASRPHASAASRIPAWITCEVSAGVFAGIVPMISPATARSVAEWTDMAVKVDMGVQ